MAARGSQAEPARFLDCLRPSTPYHEALALHDVDGRPLGESNAPEAARTAEPDVPRLLRLALQTLSRA